MSEKLTFFERAQRMQVAADTLRQVLRSVEAEATAMADAHARFEAKKPKGRSIKS